MSWLFVTNKFLLQWFFIRLAKHINDGKITAWSLMYWIKPTSGWDSRYVTYGKHKKIRHLMLWKISDYERY